jgi:hypothetical protein
MFKRIATCVLLAAGLSAAQDANIFNKLKAYAWWGFGFSPAFYAENGQNTAPIDSICKRLRNAGYTHIISSIPIEVPSYDIMSQRFYPEAIGPDRAARSNWQDLFLEMHRQKLSLIPTLPFATMHQTSSYSFRTIGGVRWNEFTYVNQAGQQIAAIAAPMGDDAAFEPAMRRLLTRIRLEYDNARQTADGWDLPERIPYFDLNQDENYYIGTDGLLHPIIGTSPNSDRDFIELQKREMRVSSEDAVRMLYLYQMYKRITAIQIEINPDIKILVSGIDFDYQQNGSALRYLYTGEGVRLATNRGRDVFDCNFNIRVPTGNQLHPALRIADGATLSAATIRETLRKCVIIYPWSYNTYVSGKPGVPYYPEKTYKYFSDRGFDFIPWCSFDMQDGHRELSVDNLNALHNNVAAARLFPDRRAQGKGSCVGYACGVYPTEKCGLSLDDWWNYWKFRLGSPHPTLPDPDIYEQIRDFDIIEYLPKVWMTPQSRHVMSAVR